MNTNLLEALKKLVIDVGDEILTLYAKIDSLDVQQKENDTPVTIADKSAHQHIFQALNQLTPNIPVLSEEGKHLSFSERSQWAEYWLVDPLDGTKEFIAKTDDFSVNIAYIRGNSPIFGIVYAPVSGNLYYAYNGYAYKAFRDNVSTKIQTSPTTNTLRITVSRHHQGKKLKNFLDKIKNYELVVMGSALKLCLVAEAKADVYLRLGPTSEWDTAAGQYILECAGGRLLDLYGERLRYNLKETLLNPAFIAIGDKALQWKPFLSEIFELKQA